MVRRTGQEIETPGVFQRLEPNRSVGRFLPVDEFQGVPYTVQPLRALAHSQVPEVGLRPGEWDRFEGAYQKVETGALEKFLGRVSFAIFGSLGESDAPEAGHIGPGIARRK